MTGRWVDPWTRAQAHATHLLACQVGGIRSTGLTASLGIAKHVARLCEEAATLALELEADQAGCAATLPPRDAAAVRTTPLPSVEALAASYRERGDGTVLFGDDAMGFGAHRVTHPLTRLGLERLAAKV